jgi:hypothetical protein
MKGINKRKVRFLVPSKQGEKFFAKLGQIVRYFPQLACSKPAKKIGGISEKGLFIHLE